MKQRSTHVGSNAPFHLDAPVLFPWFTEARNWVSLGAHALFGLVTAGVYVSMRRERYA